MNKHHLRPSLSAKDPNTAPERTAPMVNDAVMISCSEYVRYFPPRSVPMRGRALPMTPVS